MTKEKDIVPELKEDYENMSLRLEQKITNYIMLFGTKCLEELLNNLFEEMKITKIKIRTEYSVIKKGLTSF